MIKGLNQRLSPKELGKSVKDVLDDETETLVVNIWRAMIYENKKIDQHITKKEFKHY